jgi:hypothetical protein
VAPAAAAVGAWDHPWPVTFGTSGNGWESARRRRGSPVGGDANVNSYTRMLLAVVVLLLVLGLALTGCRKDNGGGGGGGGYGYLPAPIRVDGAAL